MHKLCIHKTATCFNLNVFNELLERENKIVNKIRLFYKLVRFGKISLIEVLTLFLAYVSTLFADISEPMQVPPSEYFVGSSF